MSIYGMQEPAVRDADAHMQRGERLEAARAAYCNERERELVRMLSTQPLSATVSANHAWGRGDVPVAQELAAWVRDTATDADITLAEAMFSDIARTRLTRAFALARAEMDADQLLARGAL